MPNRAVISVAGSCMSVDSSLMCCGELEWSSPTDDDELPEVTGPAWIVDNVAHYGG